MGIALIISIITNVLFFIFTAEAIKENEKLTNDKNKLLDKLLDFQSVKDNLILEQSKSRSYLDKLTKLQATIDKAKVTKPRKSKKPAPFWIDLG